MIRQQLFRLNVGASNGACALTPCSPPLRNAKFPMRIRERIFCINFGDPTGCRAVLRAMAPAAGEPKKRPCFSLAAAAAPPAKKATPRASDLVIGHVAALPPPDAVRANLAGCGPLLMAIDVETHALVPSAPRKSWWRTGRFQMQTTASEEQLATLRVVQVGWTIGMVDGAAAQTRSELVRPHGFTIDASATEKHGITQALVEARGVGLETVLEEIVAEAVRVDEDGGRLCSHHFEFDARLLHNEMMSLGLRQLAADWARVAAKGLCTMDPDIGHWCRQQIGIADKPRNIPTRLADLVQVLLPDRCGLLAGHHDAGNDSYMHWLLACDLVKRAKVT